ncbi:FliG C-terminal domain-containing protein [Ectobacillus antri]|jgi:hypothetical protein|uniref:FliG C-terminal domain-containing protein n=1 Tax=Ectobacillus antri TaxID=2486280 RepID=A0ABT6H0I6_9BACI|nr:FliG C-terminal domain-containing protein [Ectobacillus antri]MDG4656204.1 FliG C-terminal domain-containing protein [Ectobacillus antri]MDG5752879.1 FliG C-terminal domain-containing protein [Ectobacillus antri]
MNKYRVTFLTAEGLEQRSIMEGHNLPDLIQKVERIMSDPLGYFTNDKNNCYFQVIRENISYIQYELLFSNTPIHFERIKELPSAVFQQLFVKVPNPEVYALACKGLDLATKERMLSEMPLAFRTSVEATLQQTVDATTAEVYEAQSLLLHELTDITR